MTTKTTPAIKWAGESRDMIEGLLAPYGGPAKLGGKDLQGEYFTKSTDFALPWFKDWERPMLYQHGLDGALKTTVVGRIKVEPTDKGLWMQAQLDKANEYYDAIASLVDEGALGLSSGSVSHLVEVNGKSGEIKSWPLIEGSLTPTPANPNARLGYSVKSADAVAHLAVIGTAAPDELTDDEPDEDDDEAAVKALVALATKGIQTFDDIVASIEMDEDLPEAFSTLQSAIYSAIWAMDADMQPVTPDAKRAAIQTSLDQFRDYILAVLDKAGKSAPPLPTPVKALQPQALHDAAVASGAACPPSETKSEPAPLLAIAGKRAETPPVDLDAFKAQLSDLAASTAKELLG